jgi:cold shock CspA family protein
MPLVFEPHIGEVETFDKEVGLGEVRSKDGRQFPFHCTQIADGTRDITIGAKVAFRVAAGHRGTWEARSLTSTG